MGGLYTWDGRRVCDMCENPPPYGERLRYIKCPEGYCGVLVACAKCRRTKRHLHTKSMRAHCRKMHEEVINAPLCYGDGTPIETKDGGGDNRA